MTYTDIILRLIVALLLGGAIGIEREYRSKDAGFRTHFLVALGSALFTIISMYGFEGMQRDVSRVAAQVVSGIGFLGAGIIIFQRNVVRGLTTAAGLWVTAAIGMAAGTGMYLFAIVTTALVLFGLEVLHYLIPSLGTTFIQLNFHSPDKGKIAAVVGHLKDDGMEIDGYELKDHHTPQGDYYAVSLEIKCRKRHPHEDILKYMTEFDAVTLSNRD